MSEDDLVAIETNKLRLLNRASTGHGSAMSSDGGHYIPAVFLVLSMRPGVLAEPGEVTNEEIVVAMSHDQAHMLIHELGIALGKAERQAHEHGNS